MITSPYSYLETPSLLIDNDIALANIAMMQKKADDLGLKLRPHIKTHRMPYFAKLQMEAGACGIACAKIGEAEVMADNGIGDIFIANEVIGEDKYERLKALHRRIHVRIGIDNEVQLAQNEVEAKVKTAGVGVGAFGGAGVLALYGLGVLITAAILGLSLVLPAWLAALIVGVVLLAIAGIAALIGKRKVDEARPLVPERTVASVKEDVAEIKESVTR